MQTAENPCLGDTWYRYENKGPLVILFKLTVVGLTPRGVYLHDAQRWLTYTRRWVGIGCRKAYAYPTAEDALTSFLARKSRQIKILQSQLYATKVALENGSKLKGKDVLNGLSRGVQEEEGSLKVEMASHWKSLAD